MVTKKEVYAALVKKAEAFFEKQPDLIATSANIASKCYEELNEAFPNHINWLGFYFTADLGEKELELLLGPFHGKSAVSRIQKGSGVCGAAWEQMKPIHVPDVHKFSGHIACDSRSESEVVVPLIDTTGKFMGVLDVDCPTLGGLDIEDFEGLKAIAAVVSKLQYPKYVRV
eukprot:Trichotokara_eunicae@DN4658_c0_g1_i3.p1